MKFKIAYNAPVILTFSLLCTLVHVLFLIFGEGFLRLLVLPSSFDFTHIQEYSKLFSYAFAHANTPHFLSNLTFILLLGPVLEEKYGGRQMLMMMAFTVIFTALLQQLLFTRGLLGASGIVFMFIVLISFTNMKKGEIPLTFILVVFLFLGKEVLAGFSNDNVSQFAHIVGGLCGSFFGIYGPIHKKQKQEDK